jgi:hypothetical protein
VRVTPLAAGVEASREQLRALTDDVMERIRAEVGVIRGQDPPARQWDPRDDAARGAA